MERQNVTVSIPANVARRARHLAVDRGISLSRFLSRLLEERVEAESRYAEAKEQHLKILRQGFDLGTGGTIIWTREELHER